MSLLRSNIFLRFLLNPLSLSHTHTCTQFYIKDTKSSNGTFVNENRLSASGEESEPVELKSRDIVQFGVNVNVEKKCKSVVMTKIH